MQWFHFLLVFIATILGTFALRQIAIRANMFDVPNDRSSHSVATPRGGGLAIVIVSLLSLGLLPLFEPASRLFLGIVATSLVVSIIGFIDDKYDLSANVRLLVHLISSIVVSVLFLFEFQLSSGLLIVFGVLSVLYLVWSLNLFNFMDGIDGVASQQASFVLLSLYFIVPNTDQLLSSSLLIISTSILGFLVWNFPPAKIFMGDAGSGFLGFILASVSLWAFQDFGFTFFVVYMILHSNFIVDSTFTLVRRVLQGFSPVSPHRTHAYQNASRFFNSHKKATLGVLLVNLVIHLPLAYFVARGNLEWYLGVLMSYTVNLVICLKFKAGVPEESQQ
jgi:Fuc2NAc and GlcNAc transferase